MTTYANDAELRDATDRRDIQSVSPAAARFTDPKAFLGVLRQDVALCAVQDGIVYIGIDSGPATVEQVRGRALIGGERNAPSFKSSYVSVSYMARNVLHVLSAYCGVVWKGELKDASHDHRDMTQRTAAMVTAVSHAVQSGLSKLKQNGELLQVRSAGGYFLHDFDDAWQAHPEQAIEAFPEVLCATCGTALHKANGHWRDDAGKYRVLANMPGEVARGISKTRLDHDHRPEGVVLDEDGYEVGL
jgi:hypothetical protein